MLTQLNKQCHVVMAAALAVTLLVPTLSQAAPPAAVAGGRPPAQAEAPADATVTPPTGPSSQSTAVYAPWHLIPFGGLLLVVGVLATLTHVRMGTLRRDVHAAQASMDRLNTALDRCERQQWTAEHALTELARSMQVFAGQLQELRSVTNRLDRWTFEQSRPAGISADDQYPAPAPPPAPLHSHSTVEPELLNALVAALENREAAEQFVRAMEIKGFDWLGQPAIGQETWRADLWGMESRQNSQLLYVVPSYRRCHDTVWLITDNGAMARRQLMQFFDVREGEGLNRLVVDVPAQVLCSGGQFQTHRRGVVRLPIR